MYIQVESGGTIEAASARAAEWLTAERRDQLSSIVRRADLAQLSVALLDGMELRLVRMGDGTHAHYLVTMRGVRPVHSQRAPLKLSATQRRVAELAARGHSNFEIANELALSPNTVKFHLKRIYANLGVHTRMDLAVVLRAEASRT